MSYLFTKKKCAAVLAVSLSLLLSACGKVNLTMNTDNSAGSSNAGGNTTAQTTAVPVSSTAATESVPEQFIPDNSFVRCDAAICYNLTKDEIIYEKNADEKIYPASTTKLLTALTAIEYTAPEYTYYVGTETELVEPDSSMAWLYQGTYINRNEIVTAMLAPSGNDAAYVIAVNVARKIYGDHLTDREAADYFCVLMTDYSKKLGCENTNFTVPDGYHDENHYTTARDMLKVSIAAAESKTICDITCQPLAIVYDYYGNTLSWNNGNRLLTDETIPYNCYGLKTGFTDEAGFCFIGLAEMNGDTIITLTFNCSVEDKYADTKKLMDLGFGIYDEDLDYYLSPEATTTAEESAQPEETEDTQ